MSPGGDDPGSLEGVSNKSLLTKNVLTDSFQYSVPKLHLALEISSDGSKIHSACFANGYTMRIWGAAFSSYYSAFLIQIHNESQLVFEFF